MYTHIYAYIYIYMSIGYIIINPYKSWSSPLLSCFLNQQPENHGPGADPSGRRICLRVLATSTRSSCTWTKRWKLESQINFGLGSKFPENYMLVSYFLCTSYIHICYIRHRWFKFIVKLWSWIMKIYICAHTYDIAQGCPRILDHQLTRLTKIWPLVPRICCGTTIPLWIVNAGASATPSPPHPMVLMVTWKESLEKHLPGATIRFW